MKAYTTRVGAGPFPTELLDDDRRAASRERGDEFGATTGRPRRCGWFDAVVVRSSRRGFQRAQGLCITKLDVLDGLSETLKICVGYRCGSGGSRARAGQRAARLAQSGADLRRPARICEARLREVAGRSARGGATLSGSHRGARRRAGPNRVDRRPSRPNARSRRSAALRVGRRELLRGARGRPCAPARVVTVRPPTVRCSCARSW